MIIKNGKNEIIGNCLSISFNGMTVIERKNDCLALDDMEFYQNSLYQSFRLNENKGYYERVFTKSQISRINLLIGVILCQMLKKL